MIHKIWANNKQFKPIKFYAGLNVIMAERTVQSGNKDTCNGAGKTTLLKVIHFCFGADLSRLKLPIDELENWAFSIRLDICGETITATRTIKNAKVIKIETNSTSKLPIPPEKDSQGTLFYKNDDWKNLLGECLFNIRVESKERYAPSFRSLVSYFLRREENAYTDPFKHYRNQKKYDLQLNNAYLLGLNWLYVSELMVIKEKEESIKALSSSVKAGIVPNEGELEAERIRIESELKQETDAIKSFNVHPQYKELEANANRLTVQIHDLTNKIISLNWKLKRFEEVVSEEKDPGEFSVEKLFDEAGLRLAAHIKRSLKDAKSFHETIIRNRKIFLEVEIAQLNSELSSSEEVLKKASDERAELMQLLEHHGALEEFSLLQGRMMEKKSRLETIISKISELHDMNKHKDDIKVSKIELAAKLRRDYQQNRTEWEKAVALFNKNSQALYKKPGNLIINTTDDGYKLDVEIDKADSAGVGKMKIFCYDLVLIELMKQRNGIDFLFHDSTLFDSVDARQIALALAHAHKKALQNNFQYICALNHDNVPENDFEDGFKINEFVRLTLKDQKPEDVILGFFF